MKFWWVNHKQTFREEFYGEYIWCPKKRTDGRISHFYENVREVSPGDLVFSYAHAVVQGWGFANTHCYSYPRPDEFGKVGETWNLLGWRVDVAFQKARDPLRVVDVFDEIGTLFPDKYSPINSKGFGNQGAYFSEISFELAQAIAERLDYNLVSLLQVGVSEPTDAFDIKISPISEWEDAAVQSISKRDISETTKEALIQARRGQGDFRRNVSSYENSCRITKVANPTHLIASHIKPWRESSDEERLCAGNGLMLTPSIDHLFDRGFISFENNGELILSPVADSDSLCKMGIPADGKFNSGDFNLDQKHFLSYHRDQIFLRSAG